MSFRKANQDCNNNNNNNNNKNTVDITEEGEERQHVIKNVRFKTHQHEHVKEECCDTSFILSGETPITIEESVNMQLKSTVKETKEEKEEKECILPYLCPLCFSAGIREPVFLHASTEKDAVTNSVCIACAECAKLWFSMNASIESTRNSCIITSHNNSNNNNNNNNNNNMNHDAMLTPLQCPQCAVTIISSSTTLPVPFTTTTTTSSMNCVIRNCKVNVENKPPAAETRVCGICEEVTAEQYCIPCGFPLCLSCQTSSHQRGRYRTHNVVPLRAAPQEGKNKKKVHMCETHTTQSLELYCFTCHSAVCITCCFGGQHKEHNIQPINDVAEKMRQELRQEVHEHKKDTHAAVEIVRGLRTATGSLEMRFAKVREMIQRQFDILRSTLNTREAALQQELLKHVECVKCAMTQQASQCETISTAVEQSTVCVDDLIKTTDAVEMVYFDPVLKKSIEVLGTAATEAFMRGRGALQIIEERLTCENGVIAFLATPQEEEECLKVLKSFGSLLFPALMHRTTVSTKIGSTIDNTCIPLLVGASNNEKEIVKKDLDMTAKNTLLMEPLMIHKNLQGKDNETFTINEKSSLQQVSQELQLVWDQPRYTDDLSRSTVPSLMIPSSNVSSTVDNASSFSSLSFNKGAELHVLQTRKRLHDMDTNTITDKEMMMPSCKQRKIISDETLSGTINGSSVKGLMLPKRHIKLDDDGVTSTSILQEGEKMKLIDFNSKSDDNMTPTTGVASSLHLQLRF